MNDAMLVRFASATAAAACMHYPIAVTPPNLKLISDIAGESFYIFDGSGQPAADAIDLA